MTTTIFNTVYKADGVTPVANAPIILTLWASLEGKAGGFVNATQVEIIGQWSDKANANGYWQVSLTPNAQITPPNTWYSIQQDVAGEAPVIETFVAPNDTGTHWLGDVLVIAPTSLPAFGVHGSSLHQLDVIPDDADQSFGKGYAEFAQRSADPTTPATTRRIYARTSDGHLVLQTPSAALDLEDSHPRVHDHSAVGDGQSLAPASTVAFTADITPAQITSNQNDYNPTGLSTAAVLRLSTNAARKITGLQGGSDGRLLVVYNVGSFAISFMNADTGSSAGNRFSLSTDITLQPGEGMILQYDATLSRWTTPSRGESAPDVQVFNSSTIGSSSQTSGTWNKPVGNYKYVRVTMIGGGGGGGSGGSVAAPTACTGGAGGGGGGLTISEVAYADCSPTEAVKIGDGGSGGTGVTNGVGNAGAGGGSSSFGIGGVGAVQAIRGGSGGAGQNTATASNSGAAGTGTSAGGAGGQDAAGAGAGTAGGSSGGAAGGGGGGGGVTAATPGVTSAGGTGGGANSALSTTPAGGTAGSGTGGGAGATGTDWATTKARPGQGGGGGGSESAAGQNGGAGGAGNKWGGGGGGGGACRAAGVSGAGGNGAPGIVIAITY